MGNCVRKDHIESNDVLNWDSHVLAMAMDDRAVGQYSLKNVYDSIDLGRKISLAVLSFPKDRPNQPTMPWIAIQDRGQALDIDFLLSSISVIMFELGTV